MQLTDMSSKKVPFVITYFWVIFQFYTKSELSVAILIVRELYLYACFNKKVNKKSIDHKRLFILIMKIVSAKKRSFTNWTWSKNSKVNIQKSR